MNMACSRRGFLKAGAIGAGLAFLPTLALPRRARADLRQGSPALRVLILNFIGGIRSSAAFYASTATKYNPYGVIPDTKTPFALGKFLDDTMPGEAPLAANAYDLPSWGGLKMPSLRQMAGQFSVVNTWYPGDGDHILARTFKPTGSSSGADPGILTRISAGLTETLSLADLDFPSFHIEPNANFGKPGALTRYVPVTLAGPRSLPGSSGAVSPETLRRVGNDWAPDKDFRGVYDRMVVDKRAKNAKDLAEVYAVHRAAAFSVGGTLAKPFVNVANEATATAILGKVDISPDGSGKLVDLTNQMLYDAFANTLGPDDPAGSEAFPCAMEAAIAVRLLQLKSRAVCIETPNFDYHSGERDGRFLYRFVGRLWAALSFVLKRVPDPDVPNKSLFDTTLVLTMSDFGRDPGPKNGYNGGDGCDHGADASCFCLAHAVMGAGVPGGRVLAKVSTDDYRGDLIDEKYEPRQVLAMILWALGLDHTNASWGFNDVLSPISNLWGG